jgi:CSLREA domain-containing protein
MTQPIHPQRLTIRLALATLLVLALLAGQRVPVARAASIVVNTASDSAGTDGLCTLREAILNAHSDNQSGSTDCAPGSGADTITFAGDYTIIPATIPLPDLYYNLTIDGSGHSVTVSGNNIWQVFNIQSGAVVTITNLSIINGHVNNLYGGEGGGIYNAGTLTVINSTFSGNRATGSGGGIGYGGGILNAGTLTVSNSTFSTNSAIFGGGLYNRTGSTVSISNSTFDGNSTTTGSGGGIVNDGTLTVVNSTFDGNSAAGSGGGIANYNNLTVDSSTFSGNSATGVAFTDGGGGIYSWGQATVTNSTFSGNNAYKGAGIYNNLDSATVINSTFSDNSASLAGGGIHNEGTTTVIHSTISGNYAHTTGGGIYNDVLRTLHLRNSLLANNRVSTLPIGDCANSGTLATNVNNLIEDGSCSPAVSGDPVLGSLGDNGGSTQTFALLSGSPAIDAAGDCTSYLNPDEDQRGVARPQGAACDIGAYELREQPGPNFVVNVADDSDDGSCDVFGPGDCTLREAINAANNHAGADTITFAGDYTIVLASTLTNLASTLTIDGSGHTVTVSGNYSVGVFVVQPTGVVTMRRLSIINGVDVNFGGLYNFGTLAISDSVFSGNQASNGGGGIHNAGPLTISNSTFNSNTAFEGGGLNNNAAGTVTINNSTFSGNAAGNSGGVLYNAGTVTFIHSTLSGNTASINGGGLYNNNTLHLRNSLLANSTSGGECYNSGSLATNVNNLIEDGTCSPALSGDPLLDPLGSYGGSSQTFALLPGSKAIDAAGDCTPFLNPDEDQRSVVRPQGSACDIGAFESRGFTLTKTGGDNQSTLFQTAFPHPLAIGVTSTAGEPVNGGRVILTAPASGASLTTTPITLTITTGAVSSTVTANGTAGSYAVVASASGAANVVFNLTNDPAGTTTSVASTPNPSVYGQAVTLTATVTSTIGTPSGTVQFYADGAALGSAATLSNGQASLNTSTLGGGTHPITATYNGDANHAGSTSNPLDQVVTKANSTIAIASLLNPTTFGQPVTLTAIVTSTVGTPSGTVQFYADGATFGSAVTLSNGQTSLSTSALAVGTHPITATYSGDADHNGSTSNTIDHVVNPADSTTTIVSALNPSVVGQAVTLTATVTSTGDTPSGSVQFYADGATLGSAVTLSNGQTSLSTSALAVGTHPITATYSGDANHNGGISNQVDQVVNPADTTTTIVSALNPSVVGQVITLTATVTSTVGTPSGSVQFSADGATLGSPITLSNGQASLSTSVLTVGTHPITATYSGDANHSGGISNQVDQVVNPADTTIAIASALNPSVVGQAVALTATVTSTVGTPSGSVQFYADGSALGSAVMLSSGQASLSTSALTIGAHPITATYSGDTNYSGSTSNQIDQVVTNAKVYLPLISRNAVSASAVIVLSLPADANNLQIVIKNQGAAPVADEFWVDVYVNPTSASAPAELGVQEISVPRLTTQGKDNAAIAKQLHLLAGMMVNRLRLIFQEIGVQNRTAAALYALHHGQG